MKKQQQVKKEFLSVIIPAYKQEKTIAKDLLRIEQVLTKLRYGFEMVIVVDGMEDKTFEKAKKIESINIKVYGYETNKGKGYAVRYGMVRSSGSIIAFIDSGMDINPNGLSILLEHFEWYDADVMVGSKLHPVSKVAYPFTRRILTIGYQLLVKFLFGLSIRDTQVGLKLYKREVLEAVLPRLLVKTYVFDVELLAVAHRLGFKRIFEGPVELNFNKASSIMSKRFLPIIFYMFWETLAVFYRLKILGYYDDGNKRKWKYDPELDFRVNV